MIVYIMTYDTLNMDFKNVVRGRFLDVFWDIDTAIERTEKDFFSSLEKMSEEKNYELRRFGFGHNYIKIYYDKKINQYIGIAVTTVEVK